MTITNNPMDKSQVSKKMKLQTRVPQIKNKEVPFNIEALKTVSSEFTEDDFKKISESPALLKRFETLKNQVSNTYASDTIRKSFFDDQYWDNTSAILAPAPAPEPEIAKNPEAPQIKTADNKKRRTSDESTQRQLMARIQELSISPSMAPVAQQQAPIQEQQHLNTSLIAEFKKHVSRENTEKYFDTVISKMTKKDVDALLEGAPNDIYVKVKEARLRTMDASQYNDLSKELLEIFRDPKFPRESHIEITKNPMYKPSYGLGRELLWLERDNQGLLSDDLKLKLKDHPCKSIQDAYIYSVKLSDQEIDTILHRKEIARLEEQGMSRDDAAKEIYPNCDHDKIAALASSFHGYDESVTDDIYKYAIHLTEERDKDKMILNLVSSQHPMSSNLMNEIFENYKDKTGNTEVIEGLLQSERPLPDKIINYFMRHGNDKTDHALLTSKRKLSDDQAHALMNKLLDNPSKAYSGLGHWADIPMRSMCKKYPKTLTVKNFSRIVDEIYSRQKKWPDAAAVDAMKEILKGFPPSGLSREHKSKLDSLKSHFS